MQGISENVWYFFGMIRKSLDPSYHIHEASIKEITNITIHQPYQCEMLYLDKREKMFPHFHNFPSQQDYSIPVVNALELLQSCDKPSIYVCVRLPQ